MDLLAGQQRVVVLPEAALPGTEDEQRERAAWPTRALLESQGVPLEPHMWEGSTRLVVADAEDFAAATLAPPPEASEQESKAAVAAQAATSEA